jgi:hypothetical protein
MRYIWSDKPNKIKNHSDMRAWVKCIIMPIMLIKNQPKQKVVGKVY